jgi:crossover junction endodeoxyribonuclease RuvC
MLVIGIDPGTQATGFGLIESRERGEPLFVDGGVISPRRARDPIERRVQAVYEGLRRVLSDYSPEVAAVEGMFMAGNIKAAQRLGEVRGVIFLALAEAEIPITEYSPLAVKKAVVGYGQATKDQVQEMVIRRLGLPAPAGNHRGPNPAPGGKDRGRKIPSDLSDALAVALCHVQTWKLQNLIAKS